MDEHTLRVIILVVTDNISQMKYRTRVIDIESFKKPELG